MSLGGAGAGVSLGGAGAEVSLGGAGAGVSLGGAGAGVSLGGAGAGVSLGGTEIKEVSAVLPKSGRLATINISLESWYFLTVPSKLLLGCGLHANQKHVC